MFCGENWNDIVNDIISRLPQKIYISFDIDGMQQYYCPETGTPVPGGLDFNQLLYLFEMIAKCNKKIIGFDICEVIPSGENKWDCIVAAHLLYKMTGIMLASSLSSD